MLRKGWTATSLECTLCGRKLPPAMPSRPSTAALRRLEDAGSVCSLSRLGRTGHSDIDTEVIALCRSLARLAEGPPDTGRSFCGNSSNNRPAFSPPPATGKIVGVPSGCVNAHTLHRGLKAYSPAELRVRIQAGRPRSATSRRENTTHPDEGVTEYTRADAMMAMKALDRLVSFIALELSRKAVLEKKVGEVEEEVKRWEEKALDAEENLDRLRAELAAAKDPKRMRKALEEHLDEEQEEYQSRLRQQEAELAEQLVQEAELAQQRAELSQLEANLRRRSLRTSPEPEDEGGWREKVTARQEALAFGTESSPKPPTGAIWPAAEGGVEVQETPGDWLTAEEVDSVPCFRALPFDSPFIAPSTWDTFASGDAVGRRRASAIETLRRQSWVESQAAPDQRRQSYVVSRRGSAVEGLRRPSGLDPRLSGKNWRRTSPMRESMSPGKNPYPRMSTSMSPVVEKDPAGLSASYASARKSSGRRVSLVESIG
eukprot:Hpha_TRINITY_DN14165_c0_g1::TRINITY_DN14165_c0_g1_i5::g.11184::m.11184